MSKGYALVTGACSGIGLEISRELARRGYPLLMVSNRAAELSDAAAEIAAAHQVKASPIVMDLARPGAARALYDEVLRRGIQVDILVSNAGVFFFGDVVQSDPERVETMMHLHVLTPSLLAHYFGRQMCERRSGHILFTSSISAWRDFPGIAYYGSSKRFLRSFASALHEELRSCGVTVTCLAPGATATRLYEHTKVPMEAAIRYRVMKDPAGVARAAVQGMLRGKGLVVPGLSAKLMALTMTVTPRWLVRLVQRHTPLSAALKD